MAKRYIGEAVVNILYRDRGDYAGTISVKGEPVWKFEDLRAAPAGFGPGIAYDSPEAYDRMAEAATAFGSNFETVYDDGEAGYSEDDAQDIADTIGDAIGSAYVPEDYDGSIHKSCVIVEEKLVCRKKGV